ncbi:MAG: hypothetical protein Ta2A_00190 [Treponemataceae bacterium]|nr:MAG: hypothetical protein Ta2A_00190 [Treponemataceae bacterium]
MNQDAVKAMLLDIRECALDFSVIFTGKASKKVNGLYNLQTFQILLHTKNFATDNELVYTAIHEYTHHLQNEARSVMRNSGGAPCARHHTTSFWALFHELLEIAEKKGVYKLHNEPNDELANLTDEIRTKYIAQNGVLIKELGKLLLKAHALCDAAHIRFEDYIDRELCLPRQAARTIAKIATYDISPDLGYERMKITAGIANAEKRAKTESMLLAGKSPDFVRYASRTKSENENVDPKEKLLSEKKRIEKTIEQLTQRLKYVEENLAVL